MLTSQLQELLGLNGGNSSSKWTNIDNRPSSLLTEASKRSAYHYDLWNMKYLKRFKWDNLTEEIGTCTSFSSCRLWSRPAGCLCITSLVRRTNINLCLSAYKNAVREQRLAAEISAAKKERDFYLSKVDQSRAIASMEERKKKVPRFYLHIVL